MGAVMEIKGPWRGPGGLDVDAPESSTSTSRS